MMGIHTLNVVGLSVSRETLDQLNEYSALVAKWNPAINLVSKVSLENIWARHILDSAQIYPLIPESAQSCADIGSGGGFPGIVLSIMSKGSVPVRHFTFVESDQRKATFLREAVRLFDLNAHVESERIESLDSLDVDFLSARALAPLLKLISLTVGHINAGGTCVFPKGANYEQEIAEARKIHTFDCLITPSQTDAKGAILNISGLQNV
jgi:16S rRNA (guanine527-N7)-methyltransferase